MRFLKWLYPGMRVKRWLFMAIAGVFFFGIGSALLKDAVHEVLQVPRRDDFKQRPDDQPHAEHQQDQPRHQEDQAGQPQEETPFERQQGGADAKDEHPRDGEKQPPLDPHPRIQPFEEMHRLHAGAHHD